MESLLSINGIAQALGWIGVPVLAAAALLTVVVLSGGAERIIDVIEDVHVTRRASRNRRQCDQKRRDPEDSVRAHRLPLLV